NGDIASGLSLGEVIVEYGTGLLAIDYVLNSLGQSVNAYQVDILVNGAASCLDCLQSAKSHRVVVAEYNFDLIAKLSQSVLSDLLSLRLIPVTALNQKLFNFHTRVGKSLNRELGSVLSVNILRVALDHDIRNNA